jgi:hypothetical protein
VDATEDGYILKIDPSYEVEMRGEKERVELTKEVNGEECEVTIWNEYWGLNENDKLEEIIGEKYKAELINRETVVPENISRELRVYPKNSEKDPYTVEVEYASPHKCFEVSLETEVMNSMVFVDPILEKRRAWDPQKFPVPGEWPRLKEIADVYIDEETGKQIVEHKRLGYRLELEPEWRVTKNDKNDDIIISQSRRCDVRVYDFTHRFEEYGTNDLRELIELLNQNTEADWNVERVEQIEFKKLEGYPYEIYKDEGKIIVYEEKNVFDHSMSYKIKLNDSYIGIGWYIESNSLAKVPYGACVSLGEAVLEGFSIPEKN